MKKYKLGELMEVTRGMSLSGEYYSTKGELMRLTLGNFDYHKNCFKEDKSKENLYFTGEVKEGFILNKDDIVTPLTEQAIGLLGSTAKIPCSGKYIQSQDVGLIKCNDKLNPNYAFYLIPSKLVRKQLSVAAQQTKIRHTSPDKIKGCTVWIPEYDKQEKIGKLLSSLDDKIALNNRINAKLEQMAKRLYDYWFVQFDFPNADGKPYKSNGGKMVWNEELKREIPEGWEVKKLGEILILLKDGTHNPPKRQEKGIPLLTGTMFGNNFLDYDKATYISEADYKIIHSQYEPHENDVIITKIGTLGNVNLLRNIDIPVAIHCNSALLRFDMALGVYYPFSYCKSDLFKMRLKAIKGQSIQEFASLDRISSIKSEVPCVDIINKFDKIVKPIIEKQKSISFENKKLKEMRDKLLPLLMNGQVVVE